MNNIQMKLLSGGRILIAFLLLATSVHAASISGVTYDGLTLEPLGKTVVTVSTNPVQTKLSTDGTYSFNVPNGTYTLSATYSENGIVTLKAEQEVVVTSDGQFVIDLIMFPDIGDVPDEPLPDDETTSILDQIIQGPLAWLIALGVVLMAVGYSVLNVRTATRNRKHDHAQVENSQEPAHFAHTSETKVHSGEIHLDEYAMEIVGHLKRGGNRLTQKDIRGMVNIGEAKVSLVISELESYGFIKKIKRGRGNILILNESGKEYYEKHAKGKEQTPTSE